MQKPEVFILFSPSFPKDEDDTTCLPAFQQFALSYKKLYPETPLKVVALRYPLHRKPYSWHGIEVIPCDGRLKKKLGAFLTWVYAYRQLKQLQARYRIKGILSLWLGEEALIGSRFSKKYKIPHIIWISGQDAKPGNKHFNRVKPVAQQLVTMSDFLKQEFTKNYGLVPVGVVENGIIESNFPALNTGARPIDLLGVGSLIELKNYSAFIDSVDALRKQYPAINAVIIGEGPQRVMLQEKIQKLGLEGHLQIIGPIPHAEVFEYMNRSKVFLHTSHYEGNSTVLVEALYSGCKALSTQPLSFKPVPNLFVHSEPSVLTAKAAELLETYSLPTSRTLFNTMDQSVKKMMDLFP